MRDMQIIVTVSSDGTRTVAEANTWPDNLLVSGVGSSARERGDKANQAVGDDLAIARALESLAAHLKKRANGQVRHAESIKAHRAEIAERENELVSPAEALSAAFQQIGRLQPPHYF